MRTLPQRERAQLGLEFIEDAVVTLLTGDRKGMTADAIADVLGLRADLDTGHRNMIAEGILALLACNGRILWDDQQHVYVDNPDRS